MTMDETELMLDGNAVGGVLGELFTAEATTAVATCATCGRGGPVAEAHVYANGPGVVVRCPACEGVVMRFAEIRGRIVADLRGMATIQL
jgi:Family of unknown function (DUF6510)